MTTITAPPFAILTIIWRVAERDSDFFNQHPNASSYTKPYIPGEVWPLKPDQQIDRVQVFANRRTQTRTRLFLRSTEGGAA